MKALAAIALALLIGACVRVAQVPDGAMLVRSCGPGLKIVRIENRDYLMSISGRLTPIAPGARLDDICEAA